MNAHFGMNDPMISSSSSFGKILLHNDTNHNGEDLAFMCESLSLEVLTTKLNYTTRVTWSRKSQLSQLDHVIAPVKRTYKIFSLHGQWSKVPSDHKLVSLDIVFPNCRPNSTFTLPSCENYRVGQWNLSSLGIPAIKSKYDRELNELIDKEHAKAEREGRKLTWAEISAIACYVINKLIRVTKPVYTEEQERAFARYNNVLSLIMRRRLIDNDRSLSQSNNNIPNYPPALIPGSISLVRDAYRELVRANNTKSQHALREFLDYLERDIANPGEALTLAMRFLKTSKRTVQCATSVTVKEWELDLKTSEGPAIELLDEYDHIPLPPPPKIEEIENILKSMRNNKTPGLDNLPCEVFKASPKLRHLLFNKILEAYLYNRVPPEWQQTYSIPIAKKKSPKSVDDYRKLSMCLIAYKVYAIFLKSLLLSHLPSLDFYQNGFIAGRSCDDMLYTVRNILEVRWNYGRATYIYSLDTKKAFDTVDISKLPKVLFEKGVPVWLINRIISAVLTERTKILWKGQFTHSHSKSKGIKQGCPLSPLLFVVILDAAVQATKRELESKGISLYTGSDLDSPLMTLPLIVSYADDVYVLTESLLQGNYITEVFVSNLSIYGLNLNHLKSGLLIKSPSLHFRPPFVLICNEEVPVVDSLRVLGVTINSNMNRKGMIRPRVDSTMRTCFALLNYMKSLNAPMDILMRLYEIIIVPSMIFGLNCSSMSQQNRNTLMRREIVILKRLASIANPRPQQITISRLLIRRTINRKITIRRVRYFAHVKRGDTNSYTYKASLYKIEGKRKVGRPLYTFNKTLLEDLKKYTTLGYSEEEWEELYPQREIIKSVTKELLNRQDLDDDPLPDDLNLYTEYELMNMNTI